MLRRNLALGLAGITLMCAYLAGPAQASALFHTVEQETARSGWPHKPTKAERIEITSTVLFYMKSARYHRVAVSCKWPRATVGYVRCGVVQRTRKRVVARFALTGRVWEDGSFAFLVGQPTTSRPSVAR